MISWRWPRPIGVSESIALMPVASGSCTDLRSITPGAWSSRARRSSDSMSPRPSIGVPSGSMTRPRKPSPTGTERISPVRRTVWPSSILSKSPRTTTPISRVSRFSAMPRVPSSNSSSSLAIADGQAGDAGDAVGGLGDGADLLLAGRLGLVVRRRTSGSASRISSGRIVSSVISSLLSVSSSKRVGGRWSGSAGEPASGVVEPAGDGAVDDLVADLDAEAAEDLGVDDDVEVDRRVVLAAQRLGEPVARRRRQRPGDPDRGDGLALRSRRRPRWYVASAAVIVR